MDRLFSKNASIGMALAGALLFVYCFAGCGGAGKAGEKTAAEARKPVDDDLLSLAPGRPDVVLWLDLAELRSSVLWEALEAISKEGQFDEVRKAIGIDSFSKFDEILSTLARSDGMAADQFLVIIKGSIDAKGMVESVRNKEGSVPLEMEGLSGARSEKFVIVALTDRTVAVGSEAIVEKTVSVAKGKANPLRQDPVFGDLTIDGPVSGLIRYRRGIEVPDFYRFGSDAPAISVDAIKGLDMSLRLKDGIEIDLSITSETQLDAASLARQFESARRRLGQNMFVVFLGVDWMLDRVAVSTDKTQVKVSMVLDKKDEEDLKRLAERIKKIRELTEQENDAKEGASGAATAPAEKGTEQKR